MSTAVNSPSFRASWLRSVCFAGLTALAGASAAQNSLGADSLLELSGRLDFEHRQEMAFVMRWASMLNLPLRGGDPQGYYWGLARFENGRPVYRATDNLTAQRSIHIDKVRASANLGYALDGAGVTVGVWDGGAVRATHQEFGGRVVVIDGASLSSHATHVGGTIGASGVSATAQGMMPSGSIRSFNWTNDRAEMASEAAAGLQLSNHSYGLITGWAFGGFSGSNQWHWFGDPSISATEDYRFGFYDNEARNWDIVANAAPYLLSCKSAGNDRLQGPTTITGVFWNGSAWTANGVLRDRDGAGSGFDSINGAGNSKNTLTIGAVNDLPSGWSQPSDVVMSSFSCFGPTDDGRIKPDLVANGVSLTSTYSGSDSDYASLSGTSMSSPSAAGGLGLMVEHYRETHSGADMRAATLKGLAIHTANEAGANPGPDYQFGWGLMDVKAAADVISAHSTLDTIREGLLENGQTLTFQVYSNGTAPVKATLSWNDPAAPSQPAALDPTTKLLVNDLDLRITRTGATFEPWILDPANPTAAATRGDNSRDNVEQVLATSTAAGYYTIQITHKGSLAAAQAFGLVISGISPAPAAAIRWVSAKPDVLLAGGPVYFQVMLDEPVPQGGVAVQISSSSADVVFEPIVQIPAGQQSAVFTGTSSHLAAAQTVTLFAATLAGEVSDSLELVADPNPATFTSITWNRTSMNWWEPAYCYLRLSKPAPSQGALFNISISSPNVNAPVTYFIPPGRSTGTFIVSGTQVNPLAPVVFQVSAEYQGVTRSTPDITIHNTTLRLVNTNLYRFRGGAAVSVNVQLDRVAPPGGAEVALISSHPALVPVPSSITVLGGATSRSATVFTTLPTVNTWVDITASYLGRTSVRTIEVRR